VAITTLFSLDATYRGLMKTLFAGAGQVRTILLALAVAGCGSSDTSISGKLDITGGLAAATGQPLPNLSTRATVQSTRAAAEARIRARRDTMLSQLDQAEIVPGEIIVAFRQQVLPASAQPRAEILAAGLPLQARHELGRAGAHLYRAEGADRQRTIEVIEELNQRADVLYAQPSYVYHPLRVPNDEFYPVQWHYPALNLPAAWDITIGSQSTVVAVVDTGILFDAADATSTHPDFAGKVLPGFDFISDARIAVDGDGRDANPFDDGDEPGGQSSYHGSHVAGTVAAATNDGNGAAGVDWSARILPIRALGAGGGSSRDILEGVLWAAGFDIAGVPANANPADVINLSLGASVPCGPFEQEVYDMVIAKGVIVVVAAGNENQNAANVSPAGCTGVITVGATDFAGERAPYSNFGTRVDVMAPGGDLSANLDGDDFEDGVLSVGLNDLDGQFTLTFLQGTSMASPHIAGVVSLMKGLRPELTAQQAVTILRNTARPMSAGECKRATAAECGSGLVDAAAAVLGVDGPLPGTGPLAFEPDPLEFGTNGELRTLILTNTTTGTESWTLVGIEAAASNPAALPDGTVYVPAGVANGGTLSGSAGTQMTLGLDRSKVSVQGLYSVQVVFDVGGEEQRLQVRFSTLPNGGVGPQGPTLVAALMTGADGEPDIVAQQERSSFFTDYRLLTYPGENTVVAWSDQNGTGVVDDGDYFGAYPLVVVNEGQSIKGIDIPFQPVIGTGTAHAIVDPAIARALRSLPAAR
jgi:serine protease